MKLIVRLLISSAAVVSIVILVTGSNILALSRYRGADAEVTTTLSLIDALRDMSLAFTRRSASLDAYIVSFSEERKTFFQTQGKAEVAETVKSLEPFKRDPKIGNSVAHVLTHLKDWQDHAEVDLVSLSHQPDTLRLAAELTSDLEELSSRQVKRIRATQDAKASAGTLMDLAGWLGLVSVIAVTFTTSVWQLITIRTPLFSLARTVRKLESGDLNVLVPEAMRRDEIGEIGKAIDQFRIALHDADDTRHSDELKSTQERARHLHQRKLIQSFRSGVDALLQKVDGSRAELASTAQAMVAIAASTAQRSSSVAEASELTSENVTSVASTVEELGTSVQEISRQVDRSASLTKASALEADQTAAIVSDLSAAADEIGAVATLISTIAGQTNLLALNATIEAARAGAAGRGFAVVAGEVKQLSRETAKATAEITRRIDRIQDSTGKAVQAIAHITARLREINDMSAFISAAVMQQEVATEEIARNVVQAAIRTGEVTNNTVNLSQSADETAAAATRVLDFANELGRQSAGLEQEIDRFLSEVAAA